MAPDVAMPWALLQRALALPDEETRRPRGRREPGALASPGIRLRAGRRLKRKSRPHGRPAVRAVPLVDAWMLQRASPSRERKRDKSDTQPTTSTCFKGPRPLSNFVRKSSGIRYPSVGCGRSQWILEDDGDSEPVLPPWPTDAYLQATRVLQ